MIHLAPNTPFEMPKKNCGGKRSDQVFTKAMFATPETIALRLMICHEPCQFNQAGICRQCCGGVPVNVLVRLATSRCKRCYW
ncbi:MAG: hypothetical protein WCH99_04765 [Verrucomicrobiota bacterium]